MKPFIILLSALLLCSCDVTSSEIARAEEACRSNGGLKTILLVVTKTYLCGNGAEFTYNDLEKMK